MNNNEMVEVENNKAPKKVLRTIKNWLCITIGCFLAALASNLFFDKLGLVTGGITGIAIIVKNYFDIPLWITNFCLNIPLFFIAVLVKKGKKRVELGVNTLIGICLYSFFLGITRWNVEITNDLLLTAIFGAVLSGAGVGLVFRGRGTTGGTDLIGIIIHTLIKYLSVGNILKFVEGSIVLVGAYTFGIEKALYALISIYIYSKVIDLIVNGTNFAKVVYIISNKYVLISDELLELIDRGVTGIKAEGMYSHKDKKILMIVASNKEVPHIKDMVYNIDKDAFLFVTDANEVLGNGFLSRDEEV